ncbi:hypothetical protein HY490_05455 [Candidatus Woesearchaeota archaeon]|nr:hypothetical protein [Candidatus Woesearchaeota archaeon]
MVQYCVFLDGTYHCRKLTELTGYLSRDALHSARLSTGIFGDPHCPAGNRGPSGANEVVFCVGQTGLVKFVELGFLPCPVCKPHRSEDFWDIVKEAVQVKYNQAGVEIVSAEEFGSKIPFDACRVNWEELAPLVGTPNRLYVPKGQSQDELLKIKTRFETLCVPLPQVGYYDQESPNRFIEYKCIC